MTTRKAKTGSSTFLYSGRKAISTQATSSHSSSSSYCRGFPDEVGIYLDSEAGAGGDLNGSVAVTAQTGGGAVIWQFVIELLELVIGAGIGDGGDEVHHVDVAEAGGGDVRNALLAEGVGHARDLHAADHAAEVEHVLLHDGESAVCDEPAEVVCAGLLLAAGDGDIERVGYLAGLFVPVEGDWLFEEGVLVLLHELADGDGFGGSVGAVGVGGDDHLVSEGFADERDEFLAAADGRFGVAHAAAELEFDCLCVGDGDVALEVVDGLFGGDAAFSIGLVDGDAAVVDLVADEEADGAVRHFAEHVEDGELDGGDGDPDGEALSFVVVLVDGGFGDEVFDVTRVLADEERRDVFDEERIEDRHLLRVGDGDSFVAIFGADAAEILLFVAQEFDALDDDGVFEEFALEDRLLEDGVEFGVALLKCSGESVTGCVEELRSGGAWKGCGSASGQSGGDKGAAGELHE